MKTEISFSDAKFIMDSMINIIKQNVGVYDYDIMKCEESSLEIQKFCVRKFNSCPIKTTAIGLKSFFHCFDVVSISDKYSFIVDLTYKQFETKQYPIYHNGKRIVIDGAANHLSKKNKTELESMGYIPLTIENLSDYLYSFIKPYSAKLNVDGNYVLNETIETLKDYGITLCDINDFEYSCDSKTSENEKNNIY